MDRSKFNSIDVKESRLSHTTDKIPIPDLEPKNTEEDEDEDGEVNFYNLPGHILSADPEWEDDVYPNNDNEETYCAVS